MDAKNNTQILTEIIGVVKDTSKKLQYSMTLVKGSVKVLNTDFESNQTDIYMKYAQNTVNVIADSIDKLQETLLFLNNLGIDIEKYNNTRFK